MERLTEEYMEFKRYILSLKKESIFDRALKIVFYNELYRYFKSTGAQIDESITLQELYMFYLKYESMNISDYEGVAEFLECYEKNYGI